MDAVSIFKPAVLRQPSRAEVKAGREFEAVMLTNFVEQILPENIGGTDVPEAGNDVWRSFMAQAIADQLAAQSTTGIANLIAQQLMHVRESSTSGA